MSASPALPERKDRPAETGDDFRRLTVGKVGCDRLATRLELGAGARLREGLRDRIVDEPGIGPRHGAQSVDDEAQRLRQLRRPLGVIERRPDAGRTRMPLLYASPAAQVFMKIPWAPRPP